MVLAFVVLSAGCISQAVDQDTQNTSSGDNASTSEPTGASQEISDDTSVQSTNESEQDNETQTTDTQEPTTYSFSILADDNGFYIDGSEVSEISVEQNGEVTITFEVDPDETYYGGLDFRSNKFDSPDVPPGETWSVTFIADNEFTITSYWPSSNVKKADLRVSFI